MLKVIRHQYGGQFWEKAKEGGRNTTNKVAVSFVNRYSALGNQEIGTVFGSIHSSEVTNSSARLETEMTQDKGLRNLVIEILSNAKT